MSTKKELVKIINQKKEKMNDLFDQIEADLTKEHLLHPMFLELCRAKFVNEAPVDVAVTEEKIKNMKNILRDTRKFVKEYNTLRGYKTDLKSLKEAGNTKKERAGKRKRDEEEEEALAGPSIAKQIH